MKDHFESMETNQTVAEQLRDDYIHQISQRLSLRVNPEALTEEVQEMRFHLDELAKAYRELGSEPEEAMSLALKSFGDSKVVAKGYIRSAGPVCRLKNLTYLEKAGIKCSLLSIYIFLSIDQSALLTNYYPRSNPIASIGLAIVWAFIHLELAKRTRMNAWWFMVRSSLFAFPLLIKFCLSHSGMYSPFLFGLCATVSLLAGFTAWFTKRLVEDSNKLSTIR